MSEFIKSSLEAYSIAAVFMALWCALVIYGTIKKTRNTERKILKRIIRFSVSFVLIGLWIWHFLYINLFPVSLAFYEYNHNIAEEKIGIIDSIEPKGKDRLYFVIDNTEYTMVYSSQDPYKGVGEKIKAGDNVRILFGKKSGYVFDIWEIHDK